MTEDDKLIVRVIAVCGFVAIGIVTSLMGDLLGSKPSDKSAGCVAFAFIGLCLVFKLTRKEEDEDSTRGPDDPTFGNGG